jgi:transposase-like protein
VFSFAGICTSGRSLAGFVKRTTAPGTPILTDGWPAYAPLAELGYRHRPRTQGAPERAAKLLPHIHRVFGNLKTWLSGTHHGVGHDHLQAYLDEFAFRFNRRRTPMAAFQTLLGLASGSHGPITYDRLYRSESTR